MLELVQERRVHADPSILPRHDLAATPCPDHAPAAVLDSVSLHVGRARILDRISLCLARGEFVCVLGPNGAGKSTLLSMLNATTRPTAGEIALLGMPVWKYPERTRAHLRTRIGLVLQRNEYNPQIPLTAAEVVAIGRTGLRGMLRTTTDEDRRETECAIARLGLESLASREYRSLSGGEQQKTQIARALAQHPEMLLLDEPAAGLDLDWQERLTELVGSLFSATRMPVVMTTHHTHHVPTSCTRVVLLARGTVAMDAPPADALCAPVLSDLYCCRVEVIRRHGRYYCHAAGESAGC